ncbi:MAG TPA: adenylate/guanylate cyclase domain-containing protein, partial [Myxococcaceae bacterium]|nr:adenylate/guanylate cyclase domain-containing protein [Myxococcaceae bacterium]
VLFISKDESFLSLMGPMLERRGYRTSYARSEAEMRVALARLQPVVIVLDERVDDSTSREWLNGARAANDATPVIFISNRDTGPHASAEVPGWVVVPRPVLPSVFVSVFERLTAGRPELAEEGGEVEAELRALRRDYAARLPRALAELSAAVEGYRAAQGNPAACDRAIDRAHRLRGTLGTYGFEQIGTRVGQLEDALLRLLRHGAGPDEWSQIDRWLAEAVALARQARVRSFDPFTTPAALVQPSLARILLVGAPPDVAEAVGAAASSQRVELRVASDAERALTATWVEPPDAVLLALGEEPGAEENGLRLAHALRALPGAEALTVGLLTPDARHQGRVLRGDSGATVFIHKPADEGGYLPVLRQLVALREAERPQVLVVDDDPSFSRYIATLLEHAGMRVTRLHDPAGLMEMLAELQPDVLLLGVRMPGVTGFEICQRVRATPQWKDLRVLFLTASRDAESRVAAFQAGADDYLDKPIVPEELLARVKVRVERARLLRRVNEERARADELLLNVLPRPIAQRLKSRPGPIAERYAAATVLFADLVNFTSLSARVAPEKLVALLNDVFTRFDQLADRHGLEKIKTIGDAYMVAGGLPVPHPNHAVAMAEMALEMREAVADFQAMPGEPLRLRIGISSGPVVAGVIGERKFIFDVWGDTVNLASRMESEGLPDRIQLSAATADLLRDRFVLEPRGPIEVKGRGALTTYLLVGSNG